MRIGTALDFERVYHVAILTDGHAIGEHLRKLGLITARSEEKWRDVGMLVESAPGVKGMPASA